MEKNSYYFIKPFDENKGFPPEESFSQILNETYLHPFDWHGRTTRKSFWISILCNAVLSVLATGLLAYFMSNDNIDLGLKWIDGVVATVVFVWVFLAGLGQQIRRLHDVNYSGYWYWVGLLGVVGAYFILYLSFQPSVQRPVKFGNYLFIDEKQKPIYAYYSQAYDPAMDKSNVPVPTISQIVKEHFFDCFKWNYRSTRTSYWTGTVISYLVSLVSALAFYFILTMVYVIPQATHHFIETDIPTFMVVLMGIIVTVLIIWSFLAQLGHTVRRLHDAGLSGWWWWISAVPYIGNILLSFLLFHPTLDKDVKWSGYLFNENEQANN